MSKYDFEIDLSDSTSTGIILGKIRPGSVVLEFGCATGRMTRYMKEALGCTVYIVEYEKSAYEKASEFAADGVCGDIMEFEWLDKFSHTAFDAIIFADVLEHLPTPSLAVEKAATLMKPDGRMLVSLPNITHNDVLLKLYNNRFDYTPTGILDDTHRYFRGMENLPQLFDGTGVYLNTVQATYCPAGYTEQYGKGLPQGNTLLNNLLQERQCGEIYQFVLSLSFDSTKTEYLLKKQNLYGNIYVDTGRDFNGEEIIPVECEYSDGAYRLDYRYTAGENAKRLRFDPVEGQGCIVQNLMITANGKPLENIVFNGMKAEKGIIFNDADPMIIVSGIEGSTEIEISCDIILPGEKYISELSNCYAQLNEINTSTANRLNRIEIHVQNLSAELQQFAENLDRRNRLNIQLNSEKTQLASDKKQLERQLKKQIQAAEKQSAGYQQHIAVLTAAVSQLETDVGAYNMLVNVKEKYIMELEKELSTHITYRIKLFVRDIWEKIKPILKKILK